jgi:hypothetical protein
MTCFHPASFELVSGDKLSLLRSADHGEIGIIFDHNQPTAKHFFMIPKHQPKFSLKFTVIIQKTRNEKTNNKNLVYFNAHY